MSQKNIRFIPGSIVSEEWEYIDPTPDICALFVQFDDQYFWGALKGVVVKWSRRMTLCAGLCRYEGRSGMCSISLSEPLLKLRPRKDLVETLLHEMIHAYLFITTNNRDREGHGPEFQAHMHRINRDSGTSITIYHSFHNEVRLYKQHWWKCNGPCQHRPPFFGVVKRSMNRAPGPNDTWWAQHRTTCNGSFVKIKEPEGYGKKKITDGGDVAQSKKQKVSGVADIRKFFKSPTKSTDESNSSSAVPPSLGKSRSPSEGSGQTSGTRTPPSANIRTLFDQFPRPGPSKSTGSTSPKDNSITKTSVKNKGSTTVVIKAPTQDKPSMVPGPKASAGPFVPFQGKGQVLGGISSSTKKDSKFEVIDLDKSVEEDFVSCPCCSCSVKESDINRHLDSCLK